MGVHYNPTSSGLTRVFLGSYIIEALIEKTNTLNLPFFAYLSTGMLPSMYTRSGTDYQTSQTSRANKRIRSSVGKKVEKG